MGGADRIYNEVTAKHGLPLKLYRFKTEQRAMEEGTPLAKADRLLATARKRGKGHLASREVVAERLNDLRRAWVFAPVLVAGITLIELGVEKTSVGDHLRSWAYEELQTWVSPPPKDLPVTVVDISGIPKVEGAVPASDGEKWTDRAKLKPLLLAIMKQRPKAVAVDVDFGQDIAPDGSSLGFNPQDIDVFHDQHTSLDPSTPFFPYCEALTETYKVPLYLAVGRGLSLGKDEWLGDARYAPMAVHPLGSKEGGGEFGIGEISIPGTTDKIDSMASKLAGSYWGVHESAQPSPLGPVRLYTVEDENGVQVPKFYLNFGVIDRLDRGGENLVRVQSPDDLAGHDKVISGHMVIVGDASKTRDLVQLPNHPDTPGVFYQAAATDTLASQPFYTFKPWFRLGLNMLCAFLVLGVMLAIRRVYITEKDEVSQGKLGTLVSVGAALVTITAGIALVRFENILWVDFLIVATVLGYYKKIEVTARSLLFGAVTAFRKMWRRLAL